MRASNYTPGGKLTLSYTNRNYYLRGMFTYSTGLKDNGWAFTTSIGGRYSNEGNIDGTFYKTYLLPSRLKSNGKEENIACQW